MTQPRIALSRNTRNVPRRDYVALNNGLNTFVSTLPLDILHDDESRQPPDTIDSVESNSPTPFESASQVSTSSLLRAQSSELSTGTRLTTTPPRCLIRKERKEKSQTSWTLEHFWITVLDTRWSQNGRPLKNDRLLVCKRCSWSSTDSARHGTTSNLVTHLRTRHRIGRGFSGSPSTSVTSLDRFVGPSKAKLSMEQALIQWVVQTRQPFTVVEHPAFQAIFEAADVELPVKGADTLYNRIKARFSDSRNGVRQGLAQSCHSVALSLDVWTSEHQLAIFGVIGHWITPSFEKREVLLDFMEIQGAHSGENLADSLLTMIHELDIAPKLLTITGDNAGNNGTLCDALYTELRKTYDDEDDAFRIKPLMRFHGRKSFIRCLAHVINLICKEILATLGSGSAREAKIVLDELALHQDQSFSNTGAGKSAIVKIRLLVLWIARSPQRRQDWKAVSPTKQISYDVDNRWNSTYNMVTDAIRLRKELTQFIRAHPEVVTLKLVDAEWSTLEQIERVLKPFWEHTNTVSRHCPSLVDSLPIYWNLDDLLDDVRTAQGEFTGVDADIRQAVERATRKMDQFTKKMDDNILYYVAVVLDPRIKTSLIEAQMDESSARLITSEVREFLKREYPFDPILPSNAERPSGMSETLWKTLRRLQPYPGPQASDIDRYLDSAPVSWSHTSFTDGDADWVLKWWKANAVDFPCMARAARDYLLVPAAEVGVERLFSGARDVLGLRRHSLNAETMRWLVLLKGHYDNE